jgi:hypothetical protein
LFIFVLLVLHVHRYSVFVAKLRSSDLLVEHLFTLPKNLARVYLT